ncbi:MAG: sodium/solute symporter [Candidatus Wallbacteria bacterium]|nr:sodium/solute symporter [Candidatus Wallbacteria bacterium]
MFTAIDWLVVVLYCAGMLWLGYFFGRKSQGSTKSYLLGDRNMPWWTVGLSIIATETSAVTVISIPGMAYLGNLTFLQIVLGYVLARIFISFVLLPWYFGGHEVYSCNELLYRKFGPASGTLSVVLIMVAVVLGAGVRVYAAAIPLKLCLNISINNAIIVTGIITLLYTYWGGIKAVIWNDVIQFFTFMCGALLAICYIPTRIDGGLHTIIQQVTDAGKWTFFDSTFKMAGPDINIWMGVIGAFFLCTMTHGADQLLVQRVLACRNLRDGQKSMLMSACIIFPLFLTFLITGLMLWVYYQSHPFLIQPLDLAGKFKADYIFPVFIITEMPEIVKGFMIAAIIAAVMSSTSSALNALSSLYTIHIHKQHLAPNKSEEYYVKVSKNNTILWGVLLMLIAVLSQDVAIILNLALGLLGITGGGVLGAMFYTISINDERFRKPIIGALTLVSAFLFYLVFQSHISEPAVFAVAAVLSGILLAGMLSSEKVSAAVSQTPVVSGMIVSSVIMAYIVFYNLVFWPWLYFIGTTISMAVAYFLTPFCNKIVLTPKEA